MENLTFKGWDPTWANACVGVNGMPGYMEYARGFSAAANALLMDVLAKNKRGLVDQFIYPICFNMRHSVELRLKHAITCAQPLMQHRNIHESIELPKIHDIGVLWEAVKKIHQRVDDRLAIVAEFLDSFIADIASVDATGQTFRYPVDADENRHLEEMGTINLFLLHKRFNSLEKLLDILDSLTDTVLSEYDQNTYTNKLSRDNLKRLASLLPKRAQWSDVSFSETREEFMQKYGMSSREFSSALKKIEGNYEMAYSIGIEIPLRYLTQEDLCAFFSAWLQLHGIDALRVSDEVEEVDFSDHESMKVYFQNIQKNESIKKEIWEKLESRMSGQKIADLMALYYSSDYCYSEEYLFSLSIHLENCSGDKESKKSFMGILEKPGAISNIIRALFFLRQRNTAEYLLQEYELGPYFDWLEAIRENRFFADPVGNILAYLMELLPTIINSHRPPWIVDR